VTWIYAYEECARPRGPYDQWRHDLPKYNPHEMPTDRLALMWCESCDAHLWGLYTITEEPF
jgi:hypothetical protein